MQLGQHQLQILGSLVVIPGAAVVALICDFLKRNNDELRKLTVELKLRHEEELRRACQIVPRADEIAKPAPAALAATKGSSALGKEKKRPINSEALAAMERGAALAGSAKRPRSASVDKVRESIPMPEVAAVSAARVGGKRDWGSLLSRNAQAPKAASKPQAAEAPLPAGFQDGFVLSKLVQDRQQISGLVVSIGVNASSKSGGTPPESVGKLVQSLIGPQDFAAQSSQNEFLLICPQERGAAAQRRLSQIAQQLWDFQLRSLGSFQILLSWGGVEVRSESIEKAMASARERMQETKRGCQLLAMESTVSTPGASGWLRKAVQRTIEGSSLFRLLWLQR